MCCRLALCLPQTPLGYGLCGFLFFLLTLRTSASIPISVMLKPLDGEFIDLGGQTTGSIRISFNPKLEFRGDYLVFWIEDVDDASRRGPLNVKASVPKEDSFLQNVHAGAHRVKVSVVKRMPGSSGLTEPTHDSLSSFQSLDQASAVVTMQEFEVFVARYRPQPVLPWHRLPLGLEIKMDLTKGGSTARIPETWKWDVSVKLAGFPTTDSLPVKVWSEAQPGDIVASVAKQLGDPGIAEFAALLDKSGSRAPSLPSNHATFFAKQQEYAVMDFNPDSEEL